MGQNQNQGISQTIESPTYRRFVTQFARPDGTLDTAVSPILRKDVSTDGKGFKPNQRYASHTPDGHDAPVGTALTFEDGTYGGNYMPRYSELLQDIPNICGVNGFVSSDVLPDGRRKTVYQLGHAPRQLREQTAWFGYGNKCWLLKKGAIKTWSIESERSGETGGNKEYHFNDVTPNQPMVSTVAQNHKTRITAANVTGPLGLSISAPGAAAKAVSIAVGDDAAAIKAKFTAQGLTVNATGGVAVGPGEVHNVSGTGNALSIYGGISVLDKTIATLQTAIRAQAGRASAVVAGTITQATAPTGYTVTGAGYSPVNLTYTKNASGYISPNSGRIYNQGGNTWIIQGDSGDDRYSGVGTTTAPPLTGWTAINQGVAPSPTLSAIGGTPASVSLTITYDAAANVPDVEAIPGVGYAGTSTQPGAAGGVIDIEFTTPGNALVSVSKASGDANYVISTPQAGNDGSGPAELPGGYVEPNHWVVYKAETFAALQAINMGDRTTPAPIDGDTIVRTARRHSINLDNLVEAVETETRTLGAFGHVATWPEVKANITLLVLQNASGMDYAEDIFATDNRGGCGTKPFWLRFAARCGDREFWIDLWCARDETATDDSADGQAQWQFPLTRIYRSAGSLFFTVIEPA